MNQTKFLAVFILIIFGNVLMKLQFTPLYFDTLLYKILSIPIFMAFYFIFAIMSFFAAAYLKYIIYNIVAKLHGFDILTPMDEFLLYDTPANPINIASCFTFNRPVDQKPDDVALMLFKRMGDKNRVKVKIVKKYHRYFFQVLNKEEKERWQRTNCGIIDDIRTDQDALDFMAKAKQVPTKNDGDFMTHIYYIPYLNDNESAMIICGPHILLDGLTQFQSIFQCSDRPKT